jgi:tetratricopeptide (TPR) repeat protein
MRAGIAACREQGVGNFIPLIATALAEAEVEASEIEAALATIDRVIADNERTGQHWFDAESHRIRGDILLKRDPANTAPAEEAFLTSIAIAQQQKARSFELRAALSLAKLYQSANRAGDAHAVLGPALEGFAETPEFPEIEEAQTLLAAFAETDEVKNAVASRQRRLKLQTSYGQAMMWSRGFSSEEAKAAFTRAQELATGIDDPAERFTTYYGQWVGCLLRGELGLARQTAEIFLRDAENGARMTEAAVARRVMGLTCFSQGDFSEAQAHLEEALRIYDPKRDREATFSFSLDTGSAATAYLAHTNWLFGNVGRAWELIEEAVERAIKSGHVPTLSNAYHFKAIFEILRGDASAAQRVAENLVE